jgi:hypothetical protein
MTTGVSLTQHSVHGINRRVAHLTLRRGSYLSFLLAVLFGSFFVTLWLILLCRQFDEVIDIVRFFENEAFLKNHVISIRYLLCDSVVLTEPQVPNTPDNRSHAQRLAAYPISNGSDLAKSAYEADLIPSLRLGGHVEAMRRIDEQKVDLVGWAADGNGTALEVLIFVAGHLVATTHTAGERRDVTAALRLGFGARTNIALTANFACRKGDQPVVVILGNEKEYQHLQSAPCP